MMNMAKRKREAPSIGASLFYFTSTAPAIECQSGDFASQRQATPARAVYL